MNLNFKGGELNNLLNLEDNSKSPPKYFAFQMGRLIFACAHNRRVSSTKIFFTENY